MELPLSDHVRGLDPSQCRLGRMEGLEAKHRARDPLYEAMILFGDVVEVFDLQDLDRVAGARELQDHIDALQTRQISTAFVDDNTVRHAVRANCALEK